MDEEQVLYIAIFHYYALGEASIYGFHIFTDEELEFFISIWKDGFYRQKNAFIFDNNVYVEWNDFNSFLTSLKIIEITSTEADFLDRVFKNRVGEFPYKPAFEAF